MANSSSTQKIQYQTSKSNGINSQKTSIISDNNQDIDFEKQTSPASESSFPDFSPRYRYLDNGFGSVDYYVDQMSDVDSTSDQGTHNTFIELQTTDNVYDNLTESLLISNQTLINNQSFEGSFLPSGWTSSGLWSKESNQAFDGSFSAEFNGTGSNTGYLTTLPMDTSDATAIYLEFYFRIANLDNDDFDLELFDGTLWDINYGDLVQLGVDNVWNLYREKITDPQYFVSNFQIRWLTDTIQAGGHTYVDLVTVKKETNVLEFDLEVQFTDVPYFYESHELALKTGSFSDSDLGVEYWTGSVWSTIAGSLTADSWNNFTVSISESSYTIRFIESLPDTIQDWWEIDSVVLRINGPGSGEINHYVDQLSDIDSSPNSGSLDNFSNLQNTDSNHANMSKTSGLNNTNSSDLTGGYISCTTCDIGVSSGTISFWIKFDSVSSGRPLGMDKKQDLFLQGSYLKANWGAGGPHFTSTTLFTTNAWFFIALTWDEVANNLYFYIGTESASPALDSGSPASGFWTGTVSTLSQNSVYFGRGYGSGGQPIDGHMDDIRIYSQVRSMNEILNDYNKTLAGGETGLVYYYKLDNDYTDSAGNNNASLSGSGAFSADVPTWELSVFEQEMQFTNVVHFLGSKELAIKTGSLSSTDLGVQYWTGSVWSTITDSLVANSWNNITVSIITSTYNIRFIEMIPDENAEWWEIDSVLLKITGPGSKESFVSSDLSDIDSSNDEGVLTDFTNMQAEDSNYAELKESKFADITFISFSSAQGAELNTTASINKPVGTEEDDFMIAILASTIGGDTDGSTMSSSPSGWTLQTDYTIDAGSGQHIYIYWKIAGVSESSSYSWTWSFGSGWVGQINTFRNVNTTSPINVEGTVAIEQDPQTSVEPTSPSITTTIDNAMIWLYEVNDDDDTPTTGGNPSGTTHIGAEERSNPGNGLGLSSAYFTLDIAGGTGDKTWFLDLAEENSGQQFALAPIEVSADYQMTQEIQWTEVPYFLEEVELKIRTGSFSGSENVKVDFWNSTGAGWDNFIPSLNENSWNNISVKNYLSSSIFTIRFQDATRVSDSTKDSWFIDAALIFANNPDITAPTYHDSGVNDFGTGTGTFWANVTDDSLAGPDNVFLEINSSYYQMTYNGSLWIKQLAVEFGGYYTFQVFNASDLTGNLLSLPSTPDNHTFSSDNTIPSVPDILYVGSLGYNGTFRVNVSDSWGIIDTVYVNVTTCSCNSSNIAIMQKSGSEYINDTILMEKGVIFFTITVNDTAGNSLTSSPVSGTVVNKAPEVSNLNLSPVNVTSNESLTLSYSFFDIDYDLESGSEIRWYENSSGIFIPRPVHNDLTTIPSSALDRGSQWYVTVKPKDGSLFGVIATSATITVGNTIPEVLNMQITPNNPINTSTLTALYDYTDLDGDSQNVGSTEILWYKNGILESSYNNLTLLPNTATTIGESWNFKIRVHDGSEYSNWVNSTSVTILNSIPTASNVIILNSFPLTTDNLVANWTYDDLDLDPENSNWILLWFKNNELQTGLNDTKTVLSGNTTKTDIWYFKLQVFDGTNYSTVYQPSSVQILNSAPTVLDMNITQNPTTTNQLDATWTFNDDDNDAPSAIVNLTWYKDGVYQPAFDNYSTVDSIATTKGETWHYLLQVYDGEIFSVIYNSSDYLASTMILNSIPTTSNVNITNQNPHTTDDLVANWDEQDNDGLGDIDPGFKNITWYKNGVHQPTYNNFTIVNSTDTTKGELWNFILQIYDGDTFSIPVNSTEVVIQNSLPTVAIGTDVAFNDSNPTVNDAFEIDYTYDDLDGDLENQSLLIVWWFIKNEYNAYYDNKTIIIADNTTDGDWFYYIISVFDGSDYSANITSDGIIIGSGSSNNVPMASDLSISSITASTIDDLVASYTYSDPDGHPESGSEIRWYKDGVLQPEFNDTKTILSGATNKDEKWHFTVLARDIFEFNLTLVISQNITIINTAPTAFAFTITQNADNTTNLEAGWTFFDVDGDEESVLYNITWYKNHTLQGSLTNSTTVLAGNTSKNQVWYFILQVYDGENYSLIHYNSSDYLISTTILNSAPEATNLRFDNPNPLTSDDLVANWAFSDVDNDLENPSWEIFWYKSNNPQNSLNGLRTIDSGNTTKNQIWFYRLSVFDGENYSILYQSPTIQIQNTAPTVSNLGITNNPRTSDKLVATWTFADVDGDTQSVILNITWYKDGVYQPSYDNLSFVENTATTKSEIWYYLLQVHDGTTFSNIYNSSISLVTALVLNTIPEASNYDIENQAPLTTNELSAIWSYFDVDGDSEGLIYNITWYKDNQPIITFDNLSILPSNATAKGENWHFQLQVYDGEDFSIIYTSTQVIILNTAPTLSEIPSFNKTTDITTTDSIEIFYIFYDSDNDSNDEISLIIIWYLYGTHYPSKDNETTLFPQETSKGQFWSYKIQVYDGEEYSPLVDLNSSSISIEIINSDPYIQGTLTITPEFPTAGETITLSYVWSDSDSGDDEIGTEIRWYKNGVLQSVLNNSVNIAGSLIFGGDTWNVTVKVSDGTDFGELISLEILIGNSQPTIEVTIISPSITYTTTDLHANLSFSENFFYSDADLDEITMVEITWFVNGIYYPDYYNETKINSSATTKGEIWYFKLVISDGRTNSTVHQSPSVLIQNSIPVVENITISANYPILFTNNSLVLSWDYSDVDLDAENTSQIITYWYKFGVIQPGLNGSMIVPSVLISKNDIWWVEIQVFDGNDFSALVLSGSVTIQNSIATLSNIYLNNNDTNLNVTIDISLDWIFSDIDNEAEAESNITWYLFDINLSIWTYQPIWDNQSQISANSLSKDQLWFALVNVYDSDDWSKSYSSNLIRVINSIPLVEDLEFINTEFEHFFVENEDIRIIYGFSDADKLDVDQSKIMWFINDVHQSQYDNLTTIPSSETVPGQIWYVKIISFDGDGTGSIITSSKKSIENIPEIVDFSVVPINDTEGHFIFWFDVTGNPINPIGGTRPTISLLIIINNTEELFVIANHNGTHFVYEWFYTNYSMLGSDVIVITEASSRVRYENVTSLITNYVSFTFPFLDTAPPRVDDVEITFDNDENPSEVTFTVKIIEFGSSIQTATLFYSFVSTNSEANTNRFKLSGSTQSDFKEIDLQKINETYYSVTIDFNPDESVYILYQILLSDQSGNINENAWPQGTDSENLFQYILPSVGISPEEFGIYAIIIFAVVLILSFIINKKFRSKELVGLDIESVMSNIKNLKPKEIQDSIDLYSLGAVISFFDQRHGPLPVMFEPAFLKDNYNVLLDLADISFSTGRFVENFTDEEQSSFTFSIDPLNQIKVLSYSFSLNRPEARGGAENLMLNIMLPKEVFPLISQFANQIRSLAFKIHRILDADPEGKEKDKVMSLLIEIRNLISSVALSHLDLYDTIELETKEIWNSYDGEIS
ncbi:MAG: hypothetical protein HeimC3_06960 [Candidatus Heimdallarchaeota archaeon LC_3]|nr:MAG: hypothetical protein HeimC3_06960 [Candidatus Heimdallarchaeota archaeon LC_3]